MKKYQSALNATKPLIKDHSLINHEAIKQEITVLEELRDLIPPLLDEERSQLTENIKENGCREALIVWETSNRTIGRKPEEQKKFVLIDGHNRYSICQANDVDFKINLVAYDSLEEVRDFMINNQLGRRNLSPEQTSYLRGLKYLKTKKDKGKYDRENHKGQNVPYGSTAEEIAQQFNVSDKTIKRDGAFADGLNKLSPVLRKSVLSGEIKVNKKSIQDLSSESIPENSIQDLTTLAKSEPSLIPDTNSDEFTSLKDKLQVLVDKLKHGRKVVKTCNEIMAITEQIKHIRP